MTTRASQKRSTPPSATRVAAIEGRWTLQILLCLSDGALRFSDLRTAIPSISSNVLTDRIRALQSTGLVEQRYLPPPAARHLYALGPRASGLKSVLEALATWRSDKLGPSSSNSRADGARSEQKGAMDDEAEGNRA